MRKFRFYIDFEKEEKWLNGMAKDRNIFLDGIHIWNTFCNDESGLWLILPCLIILYTIFALKAQSHYQKTNKKRLVHILDWCTE